MAIRVTLAIQRQLQSPFPQLFVIVEQAWSAFSKTRIRHMWPTSRNEEEEERRRRRSEVTYCLLT